MKTHLMAALAAVLLLTGCIEQSVADPAHNSRNALDWHGVYRGTTPCADCEGIDTTVTLGKDESYRVQMRYLGKPAEAFVDSGAIVWDAAGNIITLKDTKYQVGENRLTMLDQDGKPITGALAENYVLNRVPAATLTETYWKLVTLNGTAVAPSHNEAHMILKAEDGRVAGSGGCNRMMGGYQAQEGSDQIGFTQMASTKMACIGGMDREQEFFDALAKAARYAVEGDTLTLYGADNAAVAVFEAVYMR